MVSLRSASRNDGSQMSSSGRGRDMTIDGSVHETLIPFNHFSWSGSVIVRVRHRQRVCGMTFRLVPCQRSHFRRGRCRPLPQQLGELHRHRLISHYSRNGRGDASGRPDERNSIAFAGIDLRAASSSASTRMAPSSLGSTVETVFATKSACGAVCAAWQPADATDAKIYSMWAMLMPGITYEAASSEELECVPS